MHDAAVEKHRREDRQHRRKRCAGIGRNGAEQMAGGDTQRVDHGLAGFIAQRELPEIDDHTRSDEAVIDIRRDVVGIVVADRKEHRGTLAQSLRRDYLSAPVSFTTCARRFYNSSWAAKTRSRRPPIASTPPCI